MFTVKQDLWGKMPDGREVFLFTLQNKKKSFQVRVTNLGCAIVKVMVPDRKGRMADVILGFDNFEDYLTVKNFGSIVGRVANRIEKGKFTLGGQEYTIPINNEPNTLHGGPEGYYSKLFSLHEIKQMSDRVSLILTYVSEHMEMGYPGTLRVTATITLTAANELIFDYEANALDRPTIVNLCNHGYWNLEGHSSGSCLSHVLKLHASHITPTDETLIPTGKLQPVKSTPYDFTIARPLSATIAAFRNHEPSGRGFDINYVIDPPTPAEMKAQKKAKLATPLTLAATLCSPSGRCMDVRTNQPGIQLYSGNWFEGKTIGKEGVKYNKHAGVCLETQAFPDAINKPDWRNQVTLIAGDTKHFITVHKFYNRVLAKL